MLNYQNLKQNKVSILPFPKLSTFYLHSFSMDTKGPLNIAFDGNHYIYSIVDLFSTYIVTEPTPKNTAHCALNAKFRQWISHLGPA